MPDPARGWHSFHDECYPFSPFTILEWADNALSQPSFFQAYTDFPPYSNMGGLYWRAVPTGWPITLPGPR